MPLRDDLLTPISGDNPSGKNLRYDRVYDQIKEARTEEDSTLPAGAWERTAKRADYRLVVKLAGETLATKTKDLQIAAWLGEAHLKQEGVELLAPVLTLLLDLQKEFWETIYPENDEGDLGLRAVPLQWAANRYAVLVQGFALTRSGIDSNTYKAARAIGYEADAEGSAQKRSAREQAQQRGQLTAEDIDSAVAGTPKSFYAGLDEQLTLAREVLEDLALFCEEQYLDDGPSFGKLRDSLEQVHNLVTMQLNEKRRLEPDVVAVEDEPEPEPLPEETRAAATPAPAYTPPPPSASAVPRAAAAGASMNRQPTSWDEAVETIQACATYMHTEREGSAVPYLIQTAIRWGELRRNAPNPPLSDLVGPASEDRQALKSAALDDRWSDVLERAMRLVSQPCSRAWLDLHRYIWTATHQSGYEMFAGMVIKAVQGLLADLPDLPTWTLNDDTATANAETLQWIAEYVTTSETGRSPASYEDTSEVPEEEAAEPEPSYTSAPVFVPQFRQDVSPLPRVDESPEGDLFEQASALADEGNLGDAVRMLARDAAAQPSGRLRYKRRLEMAQLCVARGSAVVASPMLRDLIAEIDERHLESWESSELVARPLALMLQCLNGDSDPEDRQQLFAKLCRVDPTIALDLLP